MKLPIIYLLRHGQTEWNLQGRFQGHSNSDLTERGKADATAQGELLHQVFADHPDIQVFASPQGRVRQTAEIALRGHAHKPVFADALKEINIGIWSGLTIGEIKNGWPSLSARSENAFDLLTLAPEGETMDEFFDRGRTFLASLTEPSILFCHGALIAVLRTIARDLPRHSASQFNVHQGCIYQIENGIEKVIE